MSADTSVMRRTVDLQAVEGHWWSLRAVAWGYDASTGDHVSFAVNKTDAVRLRELLEVEDRVRVEVDPLDILFSRPVEPVEADAAAPARG